MPFDKRCVECAKKSYYRLLDKFPLSENKKTEFEEYFIRMMDEDGSLSILDIGQNLRLKLQMISGIADPYFSEKKESNRIALELYKYWQPEVGRSGDPFKTALRLAVAGNIMDYGANQSFNIGETIERVLRADFAIDHSDELKKRIRAAKSILYLGDNAGEIVFDKLFIETIQHPAVTFAVRGGPAINDVTLDDARETGIDEVAAVISNGYNAPSTILEKSGDEFKAAYNSADLIISKGQGNFEGLLPLNDSRIFFLLMAKCDVFAEYFGVAKESFLVYNPKNQR